jgi:hypothetical protein
MATHEPQPERPHDDRRPPVWLIHVIIILVVAGWVPFALIAESRTNKDRVPPIHFFQDMDVQPKLKAQASSPLFNDGRAMRPRIGGTVARGELAGDDHYHRGYRTDARGLPILDENDQPKWFAGYPDSIDVTEAFIRRGRERFDIFCAPCHGRSGRGQGIVHQRAQRVQVDGWVQPTNLHDVLPDSGEPAYGVRLYPNGKLLHTIGHGANTMRGYASQIPIDDRWAIVAYVRALQLSHEMAAGQQAQLEGQP